MKIVGVKRMHGVGKESGKPFDFAELYVMVPVENAAGAKFTVEGFGFEVAQMECESIAVAQFAGLDLPAELELSTTQKLVRGEFKTVCTGVFRPGSAAALSHAAVQRAGVSQASKAS